MPEDRIVTPFSASTTAAEVLAGISLTGRRAVVTGATSGIGRETARVLAAAGAEVTLAVRDVERGHAVAVEIEGPGAVTAAPLELTDLASVRAFIAAFTGPLDILVNNAGVMATPERRTAEGWEWQLATNHLGHFALTTGLHDALAASGHARVVNVSSVGHLGGDVDFADPNFERRPYDPWVAYGQSKTANILFAVGIARRWAADGITANALNPGRIAGTNLIASTSEAAMAAAATMAQQPGPSVKDIPQGAATSVLLAASPRLDGVSGRYFEDCQEAGPVQPGIRRGVAAYALDPANADRLWALSEALLDAA
jgi:NAD(P)-dependent dehydrogenase (short-subunit alcohol dehydrogenase family)